MQETKNISTPEKTKRLLIAFVVVFLLCVLYSVITAKKNADNGCGDWIITQGENGNYVITQNKRFLTCNNAVSTYTCENKDYCGFYTSSKSETLLLFDNSHNYSYNVKSGEKKQLTYLGDNPHYYISEIPNASGEIVGLFVYAQDEPFLYKFDTPQNNKHIDYLSEGSIINISCNNVSYSKELLEHNYISCDGSSAHLLDINTFTSIQSINYLSKDKYNMTKNVSFRTYNTNSSIFYVAVINATSDTIPQKNIHDISTIDLSFITGTNESNAKYLQFYDSNLHPIVEQGDYFYLFNNDTLFLYDTNSSYYYTYNNGSTTKSKEYERVLDIFSSNSLKDKYSTEESIFLSVIDTDNYIKIIDTRDNAIISFPDIVDKDGDYMLTISSDAKEESSISIVYGGILYNYTLKDNNFSKEDISYISDIGKQLFGM